MYQCRSTPVSKRESAPGTHLMGDWDPIERLSTKIWPTSYFLDLKINLPSHGANLTEEEEFMVSGTVRIDLDIQEETSMIQLHAKSIDIVNHTTFMIDENGKETALSVELHPEQQKIHLLMTGGAKFPVGTYSIKTSFQFKIQSETSKGLYYYSINELDGSKRYVMTSQCEPLLARMIAPCFDEPEFKAKWQVNIAHPVGTTAIANGKKISVQSCPNHAHFLRTQFDWTPPMSSYLLAISVSHFPALRGNTKKGTEIHFYIREQYLDEGALALKSTIKILEFLEELFDIEYPMTHLDAFAATKYSYSGMENYGLIVYDENDILFNPLIESVAQYRKVVALVAHEVTHQWFGNLVTMKWWNNTWLNEGITSYVEDLASDAFDENIEMSKSSLFDDVEYILKEDHYAYGQQKTIPSVTTNMQVMDGFSLFSYKKGAAIMRMLAHTVKEEVLIAGLRKYLKKHAYGNTDEQDLWSTIQEVVDEQKNTRTSYFDVKKFGEDWTTQNGYPIIVVNRTAHPHKYRLTQKRGTSESMMQWDYFGICSTRWTIPVSYTAGNQEHLVIMDDKELIIDTKGNLPILNQGGSGYYRVDYSDVGWDTVAKEIENHRVPDGSTRIRLYLDLKYALNIGRVNSTTVFNHFMNLLKIEKDPLAFVRLYQAVLTASKAKENSGGRLDFYKVLLGLRRSFKDVVDSERSHLHSVNGEVESFLYMVLYWLDTEEGQRDYLQEFRTKAFNVCRPNEKFSECSRVSPYFRKIVYCFARRFGTVAEWDRIEEAYESESHRVERENLLWPSSWELENCYPEWKHHGYTGTPPTNLRRGGQDNNRNNENDDEDLDKLIMMEKALDDLVLKLRRNEVHKKKEEKKERSLSTL